MFAFYFCYPLDIKTLDSPYIIYIILKTSILNSIFKMGLFTGSIWFFLFDKVILDYKIVTIHTDFKLNNINKNIKLKKINIFIV